MKKLTWQDKIKQWSKADKLIYVKLTDEERAEVNAFAQATANMTMAEVMAYTKKTQPDGHHPFFKHREKHRDQDIPRSSE